MKLQFQPGPNVQCKTPDDGQRNCPKHVEFLDKNKFRKLVRLLFLLKRTLLLCSTVKCYDARSHITMQHGHMLLCSTVTCYYAARSHITMQHGHMLLCSTVTCYDARSHVTMQHGHMLRCTVTCYDAARSHERKV
jgi:hypothetical protein